MKNTKESLKNKTYEKVMLIVLDGFGKGKKYKGNAITKAKIPYIQSLQKNYPTTLLKASGNAVGLPKGYMGNSEVGHFTLGAGRIQWQSLEAINNSIKQKQFSQNKALLGAFIHAKKKKTPLHLMGMISDEGVHSHIDHLFALLQLAKEHKLKKVYIHAITDGRDVAEKSAKKYIRTIQKWIKQLQLGSIASIIGRFYAMDRDNNWDRTQIAYQLFTEGKGRKEKNPITAIENGYKLGDSTDYYLNPILIDQKGLIQKNDAVIFFNYRTDRSRQLTWCFTGEKEIPIPNKIKNIYFVCMGPYSKKAPVAFDMPELKNNLGQVLSNVHLEQLRIAETEKYAHVTFFFNSQRKEPYLLENRILINSPKVPSYDMQPEMSAPKITETVIPEIKKRKYHFIMINFANADLVAHSGVMKATIQCIECLDKCISKIIPVALNNNYHIILTADHGNAEKMLYEDGSICPAHSTNPVPCTLISESLKATTLKENKGLKDIAPTILNIMGIPIPKEMTGKSLINSKKQ